MQSSNQVSHLKYLSLAFAAFGLWGIFPIYFKWVENVSALEILSHRVVWSVLILVAFMVLFRKAFRLVEIVRSPRLLFSLALSSLFISINWGLYVWAVISNQILSTSLGYFINPLVSVVLGVLFLGERLNARQGMALLLVVLAVANMIWSVGELPWLSLSLALTFGLYGLIRKQVAIDSFNGLLFEVLLVLPIALVYLHYLSSNDTMVFTTAGLGMDLLLILSGVFTILPLVLFAAAVKKVNLSTIGFIQYTAPTISFCLAVFAFNEPFSVEKLISFLLIWIALALISFDAWRRFGANAAR